MPLLRVKRHMQAISSRQECKAIAELYQWREPATTERGDVPQHTVRQAAAAFLRLAFLER
ncbi:MAG: hypothetical protein JO033_20980 [Acidobacteriaceae bacterium]|nr:hypothetical protein [Acidobacteriaceae bacterium]MBV9502692.1 hypothetical protein [Acidobacteriaceae bacterium]